MIRHGRPTVASEVSRHRKAGGSRSVDDISATALHVSRAPSASRRMTSDERDHNPCCCAAMRYLFSVGDMFAKAPPATVPLKSKNDPWLDPTARQPAGFDFENFHGQKQNIPLAAAGPKPAPSTVPSRHVPDVRQSPNQTAWIHIVPGSRKDSCGPGNWAA